jgi:hypothetical protein
MKEKIHLTNILNYGFIRQDRLIVHALFRLWNGSSNT